MELLACAEADSVLALQRPRVPWVLTPGTHTLNQNGTKTVLATKTVLVHLGKRRSRFFYSMILYCIIKEDLLIQLLIGTHIRGSEAITEPGGQCYYPTLYPVGPLTPCL